MHVTTKDVDKNGVNILTSVIENDGPNPICSEQAKLSARVISVQRTASGGIQVQTAVAVSEPTPVVATKLTPSEEAIAYLQAKRFSRDEAKADVEKFGVERVLAAKAKEAAEEQAKLDEQLAKKLDR